MMLYNDIVTQMKPTRYNVFHDNQEWHYNADWDKIDKGFANIRKGRKKESR